MADTRKKFDPSHLGDPIAMQTDWTYTTKGMMAGANFRTHKLVEINSARLEFKATIWALLFYLIFLVAPVVGFIAILYKLSSGGFSFYMGNILRIVLIAVITPFFMLVELVSWGMLYSGTTPIVFDKLSNFFWKGRKTPNEAVNKNPLKEFAKLEDIHALQLVSEYFRGGKGSSYIYELNLVLEDGKRIIVVEHGDEKKLREDTNALSEFLGKPVWDAIKD
jgi:hypothetical protein